MAAAAGTDSPCIAFVYHSMLEPNLGARCAISRNFRTSETSGTKAAAGIVAGGVAAAVAGGSGAAVAGGSGAAVAGGSGAAVAGGVAAGGSGAAAPEPDKDDCSGPAFLKTKRVMLMKRVYYIQVVMVLARGVP